MSTEAQTAPQATDANGSDKENRLRKFLSEAGSKTKNAAKDVVIVSKEVGLSPARFAGRLGLDWAGDAMAWWQHKVPSTVVGVPLAAGVVTCGLVPLVAPAAMVARGVKNAETILGAVLAGTAGFLAGTALVVWFWEGAVVYAVIETMLFVSKSAALALSDEHARDLALANAA